MMNHKSIYRFDSSDGIGSGFGVPGSNGDAEPLMEPDEDDKTNAKQQCVAALWDEGSSYYINRAYRESVLCYAEVIGMHTDESQFHSSPKNDGLLAALYGN